MSKDYNEFMVLARLAEFLEFPVGVIEQDLPTVKVFTLVVELPTGLIYKKIPRSQFKGRWLRCEVSPELLKIPESEYEHRLNRIIFSVLKKTIETAIE